MENQKIIDWIVFDFHGTFFPKADRDNHGESLGVFDYDFRWHVGDRFTILSDGYADTFSQGLKTISLGARLTRPEVGNLYVGFRSIEGPISANVLNDTGAKKFPFPKMDFVSISIKSIQSKKNEFKNNFGYLHA